MKIIYDGEFGHAYVHLSEKDISELQEKKELQDVLSNSTFRISPTIGKKSGESIELFWDDETPLEINWNQSNRRPFRNVLGTST